VFKQMYQADPSLAPLLEGMGDTACGAGALAAASMQSAFSTAALDALSGGGGAGAGAGVGAPAGASLAALALPHAEELAAALVAERRATPPPPPTWRGAHEGPAAVAAAAAASAASSPLRPPGLPRQGSAAFIGALPAADSGALAAALGGFSPPPPPPPLLERAPSGGVGGGLARAGSGGLSRAGSISSKKASPNRVCCNALLAAYARAAPAQWRRALALLAGMWACGGELTPDIVRCGRAASPCFHSAHLPLPATFHAAHLLPPQAHQPHLLNPNTLHPSPTPAPRSYNTAIKAAGAARQVEVAYDLYLEMRSRGIEATAATFGALLGLASEAGAWGKVADAWGWLQASGLPCHVGCANTYLTALLKLVGGGFGGGLGWVKLEGRVFGARRDRVCTRSRLLPDQPRSCACRLPPPRTPTCGAPRATGRAHCRCLPACAPPVAGSSPTPPPSTPSSPRAARPATCPWWVGRRLRGALRPARPAPGAPGISAAAAAACHHSPATPFTHPPARRPTPKTPTQALDFFDELLASNLDPNQATFSALAATHARAGAWARTGDVLRHMGAPASGAAPTAGTYALLFRVLEEGLTGGGVGDADRAAACARWAGSAAGGLGLGRAAGSGAALPPGAGA
jgi:pentatricopeptide repeat protein